MPEALNDFAGRILILGVIWYAAEQALVEWRDRAIRKLNNRK